MVDRIVAKPGGDYIQTKKKEAKNGESTVVILVNFFNLESGDCLLFYGDGKNHVCHGSVHKRLQIRHQGMPDWCNGYRVSVQYRFSPHWHP